MPARPVIGRWAQVLHKARRLIVVGTVIDAYPGTQRAKRIRIQRGPLQGEVVQPHEYEFKGFIEDEEVDP